MANIHMYRGGTPNYIGGAWCAKDYTKFNPPFGEANLVKTPPYDSHIDGAYNLGNFTLGMPVRPNGVGMEWQRKAMDEAGRPEVGDVMQLIVVPHDHFVTALNFKVADPDARLAGAAVKLVVQSGVFNADGEYVITTLDTLDTAMKAQGLTNAIALDNPSNTFVSLLSLASPGGTDGATAAIKAHNADSNQAAYQATVSGGYIVPLYANPTVPAAAGSTSPEYGRDLIFGLEILSLPNDPTVSLAMAQNGWYLSLKAGGFECPTNY